MTISTKARQVEEIKVVNDDYDQILQVEVQYDGDIRIFDNDAGYEFFVPAEDVYEFAQAINALVNKQ